MAKIGVLQGCLLAFGMGLLMQCSPQRAEQQEVTPHAPPSTMAQNGIQKMKPQTVVFPKLERWLNHRNLDQAALRAKLKPTEGQEDPNRSYQKLKPAAWMHNAAVDPGHYYFQEGKVVMIYLSDKSVVDSLDQATFEEALGACKPEQDLASRVGKRAHQYVYPEAGIAYAVEGGNVRFVEIFQPCTLQDYLDRIYEKPAARTL